MTRKTMALFLLSLLLVVYTTTTALAKNTQGGNPGEGYGNEDKPADLNPAGVALHIGQHVGVSVQGDGDAGVSEHFGHYLRIDVLGEKQRGASMPKVVKSYLGQLCPLEQGLEAVRRDVVTFKGLS